MAEQKKTVGAGKQNRDASPFILGQGETTGQYRSLMNGRVARSEGGDVGALENLRGNAGLTDFSDPAAIVIGSIRDQLENKIYYFIVGERIDGIYEYDELTNARRIILRSTSRSGVLKFSTDNLITGVNLIGENDDRLLYWTDNKNAPRRINIERMVSRHAGRLDGVVDDDTGERIHEPFTEEEISVVKAPPLNPPIISGTTSVAQFGEEPETAEAADAEENLKEKFIRFAYRWKYIDDEYSVFSPFSDIPFAAGRFEYDRKTGQITSMENLIRAVDIAFNTGPRDVTEIDLLYIDTATGVVWVVETYNKVNEQWDDSIDLGRVIIDNFEEVEPTRTYNLTGKPLEVIRVTVNNLEIVRPNYATALTENGRGVLEFPANNVANATVAIEYSPEPTVKFSSNKLYRPLPQDDLFRVYDDVPRRARSQDIIENRIVYGDYVTRYNIEDLRKVFETVYRASEDPNSEEVAMTAVGAVKHIELVGRQTIREEIIIDFDAKLAVIEGGQDDITDTDLIPDTGIKNLKSDRDYEIAVVYGDNVGRRTPPLTSVNNAVHIPRSRANRVNKISVDMKSKAPEWATWYRFFIKNNKKTHYNIIPLQKVIDPYDPDSFIWFRLSDADKDKVKTGDYLNLKVSKNEFISDQRVTVRVEDASAKERNFLEAEPPRIDPADENSAVLTLQQPGLWMKIKSTQQTQELLEDDGFDNSFESTTRARPNNSRGLGNYEPIQNTGTAPTGNYNNHTNLKDYIDNVSHYSAPSGTDEDPDATNIVFAGTYNPAATGTDQDGNAWLGGGSVGDVDPFGSGPMRIVIEITASNTFKWEYFINHEGTVNKIGSSAYESDGVHMIRSVIDTEQAVSNTPITLVNGITVQFDTDDDDVLLNYNIGDRFTVTCRRAHNFLWTWLVKGRANPNFGSHKSPENSGKANVVFPVHEAHLADEGIYGNSRVQIGLDDGQNASSTTNGGHHSSLPFDKNSFVTKPVYYPNIEEFMFEEGLWHPQGADEKRFIGTNKEGGNIGMSQFGFWRGTPGYAPTVDEFRAGWLSVNETLFKGRLVVAALFSPILAIGAYVTKLIADVFTKFISGLFPGRTAENGQYRIFTSQDDLTIDTFVAQKLLGAPLYCLAQSGKSTKGSNRDAPHYRISADYFYSQGNVGPNNRGSRADVIFETIPDESALDDLVFYETSGDTLSCLNGIHFGTGMTEAQLITFLDEDGNEVMSGAADAFEALTETGKVTSIPLPIEYWNCIAFNNGVESMTIRDEFGTPEIGKGVKAANVIDEYEEVRNFAGLIYSGPFADSTGINRLNEFSSFDVGNRTIVKDLDENYGPIRKLYAENTDLIVFQESKVNKVQVDKDSLFNADGSVNVTASNMFLNQTIPLVGEYGISDNPESFAVYGRTKFWADRNRGVILSLEGDQIIEESDKGMRDYFRDNLATNELVLGMYDDYHDQYIVHMRERFPDISVIRNNIPLLISRQGFLSRNEACRFPTENLQYQQVYEFYEDVTPLMFTVGDILYTENTRESVFNGENDWFIAFEKESIEVTSGQEITSTDNPIRFVFGDSTLNNAVMVGQNVFLESILTATTYSGTITQVSDNDFHFMFSGDAVAAADSVIGATWDLEIDFKFVVNIDNFGVVRRKLDCIGVPPLNHDAFRVSLFSYSSPLEACANGLVGQILYHNGNDATPDLGDSIYDSPYAGDEYVEVYQNWLSNFPYNLGDRVVLENSTWRALREVSIGVMPGSSDADWEVTDDPVQYMQGRTQRRGWYKMFDGDDSENYVIRILQGKVATIPELCSGIMAGRTSVLRGDHFIRETAETDNDFAARVCRSVPGDEAFHDGDATLPVVGDTFYQDNHTERTYGIGTYPISGGFYITVNEDGIINEVVPCFTRVCISELVNTYASMSGVFASQISTSNIFSFLGIIDEEIHSTTERQPISQITLRWSAKGARRYPADPSSFYELIIPDGLGVGQATPQLTNAQFVLDSANDSDLEYSLLEMCYNRSLVPQRVGVHYYNDGGEQHAAMSAQWTNATSTTDAQLTFNTAELALRTWNFLTGDTETAVPTTALPSVAREDFRFSYISSSAPLLTSGSAITLQSVGGVSTIVFVGTGVDDTLFAFPTPPVVDAIINVSSGGVPICTDISDGITYTYPSRDALSIIARIFDTTGNLCVGGVQVSDEIYYNRFATTRRQYFTADSLLAGVELDGTDGITDTDLLTSVVIDGITRYGLWWAFGTQDNAAAEFAYLIDINGFVLDTRTAAFPADLELCYGITELLACSCTTPMPFLGDHPDFYSSDPLGNITTQLRIGDGLSLPSAGWYSWVSPEDGETYVREWLGTAFGSGTIDNCPLALPHVDVFYSTDEQDGVCSRGSQLRIYVDNGAIPLVEDAAIDLYTNPFGRSSTINSELTPGFIQLLDRTTVFTWNGTSLAENNVPCTQFCTDVDATNTDTAGDCRYPTYCSNSAATNFNQLADGTATTAAQRLKFTPSATSPICNLPAQRTVTINVVNNIGDPTAGYDIPASATTVRAVAGSTGVDGDSYGFTGGGVPTISDTALYRVVEGSTLAQTITNGSGDFLGMNEVITLTYSGSVEIIPEEMEEIPVGCNMMGADNRIDGSDGTATCYYVGPNPSSGGDGNTACDSYNEAPTTVAKTQLYVTNAAGTIANGDSLYTKTAATTTTPATYALVANGWWTDNGVRVWQTTNGVVSNLAASGCPAYPRVSGVSINLSPTDPYSPGQEFSATVRWTAAGGTGQQYDVQFRGDGVLSSDIFLISAAGDGSARLTEALQIRPTHNRESATLTATIFLADTTTAVGNASVSIEITLGIGGRFT